MGTITKRMTSTGEIRYRAQVRIKRNGLADFTESRTFSKKSLANEWIKKREFEFELDPEVFVNQSTKHFLTLAEALEKYLKEVTSFGRSKRMGIRFLTVWPIGKILIKDLKRQDFTDHTLLRRSGYPEICADPIEASTALQDLQYLKVVLSHADLVWGEQVNIFELEQAMKGLRNARIITKSKKRDELFTSKQLQQLTNYFYKRWHTGRTKIPMHLIMWLAIYSCRRETELTELFLNEFNRSKKIWKVFDLKNPNGSEGNHKSFVVSDLCLQVINELLKPEIRDRMLSLNRDPSNVLVPVDAKSYAARWREGIKMCGLDGLRFHDLRHEGITRLAEDGLTIPQIQQHSLHESWESLRRYVNLQHRDERLDFSEAIKIAKKVALN
ncbi:tyrosine-type recombinase/integrase [Acinetobacter guillouiae]|uniref:tyrosine-type recombinase/integrase n=1 Tax=Acinetobacter guillouiae TaxID=106649 RepID=UPI0028D84207|nr:tyrosine-type recombinase/integrase [Acinetobacter guillouiae]